jgi:hypothetical protein
MYKFQAAEWLRVWDQAQNSGTVVEWLTWLAENGYRITQEEPTAPLAPRTVWSMVTDKAQADGEDETPTVCTDPACGRVQPRWTMEQVGGRWVCSPKYAMSCGRCCAPGVFLTHYKEDEHQPPCRACDSETHARCQHTLGRQLP